MAPSPDLARPLSAALLASRSPATPKPGLQPARAVAASHGAKAGASAAPPPPPLPPLGAGAPALWFAHAAAPGHRQDDHVEQPARVDVILRKLQEAGLTGGAAEGQVAEVLGSPMAALEAVQAVHSYVDDLRRLSAAATADAPTAVADIGDPDGVTYVTSSSFCDALRAAGAACALVDAVVAAACSQGASAAASPPAGTAGFALTRPPGHHATADTPLGYCLFNNVALAARHAQQRHGLAKVLILDFDLHHGNGTQGIFYGDPSVLFIDTHEASSVYDDPPHAPSGEGDTGAGAGVGATINIPLPRYAGDAAVLHVFDSLIAPAARRFEPDIILISAGFDAHWRDPFQQLQFRSSTYHSLARRLQALAAELCGGRLVLLLEGGYHTEAVGESVCEVFRALLGQPSVEGAAPSAVPQPEPVAEVAALVQRLRGIHGLD